jgi:hypothetical protein
LPSSSPSSQPIARPSGQPTTLPTSAPSPDPTSSPTRYVFPTGQPSSGPSSRPTRPTAIPTARPTTSLPTVSPTTRIPTAIPTVPPTLNPSANPTRRPTATPTARPSFSPTSSVPVISFQSNLTLTGLINPYLSKLDRQAVVNSTAFSMGISPQYVSIKSEVAVPISASVSRSSTALKMIEFIFLGSNVSPDQSQSLRRRLIIKYDMIVKTQTVIPTTDIGTSDPIAFYQQITEALETAVQTGTFSETLRVVAKALGANNTANANATAISSSNPTLIEGYTPPTDDDTFWTPANISGIVIGAVAFIALICAGSYFYLHWKQSTFQPKRIGFDKNNDRNPNHAWLNKERYIYQPRAINKSGTNKKEKNINDNNNEEIPEEKTGTFAPPPEIFEIYPEPQQPSNVKSPENTGAKRKFSITSPILSPQSSLFTPFFSPVTSPEVQRDNSTSSQNAFRFDGTNPLAISRKPKPVQKKINSASSIASETPSRLKSPLTSSKSAKNFKTNEEFDDRMSDLSVSIHDGGIMLEKKSRQPSQQSIERTRQISSGLREEDLQSIASNRSRTKGGGASSVISANINDQDWSIATQSEVGQVEIYTLEDIELFYDADKDDFRQPEEPPASSSLQPRNNIKSAATTGRPSRDLETMSLWSNESIAGSFDMNPPDLKEIFDQSNSSSTSGKDDGKAFHPFELKRQASHASLYGKNFPVQSTTSTDSAEIRIDSTMTSSALYRPFSSSMDQELGNDHADVISFSALPRPPSTKMGPAIANSKSPPPAPGLPRFSPVSSSPSKLKESSSFNLPKEDTRSHKKQASTPPSVLSSSNLRAKANQERASSMKSSSMDAADQFDETRSQRSVSTSASVQSWMSQQQNRMRKASSKLLPTEGLSNPFKGSQAKKSGKRSYLDSMKEVEEKDDGNSYDDRPDDGSTVL